MVANGRSACRVGETEPDRHRPAGTDLETIVGGGLGADPRGVDRVSVVAHDERVKGVFDVGAGVWRAEEPLGIRVVLGESSNGDPSQ